VGLETLHHWDELPALLALAPSLVFSLDLRAGEPLGRTAARPPGGSTAETIAVAVAAAGVREVLLLDLARVGRPWGPDFARLAAVRAAAPDLRLLAGGGVRDAADLAHLEQIGVDGVLLASALHRGTLAVGWDQSSASEVR
jgi:phosphoribosylformimino-5-aminoimidazole carboxamide ribotide isomerase